MKIEILKENLRGGLGVVDNIIGKNISLPILNNVHLDTEDIFLVLTSTDLETAIRYWILTKIIKKGKAVVPAKFLSSFVGSLPNEKIMIEGKGQDLQVECKGVKTQVKGFGAEDFPIIPSLENAERLEVDNKKLCEGLSQVIDIPVASQARPEISGIYFSFSKNGVKVVATDSFRLAEKHITLQNPLKKDFTFILPQKPAREVLNVLQGKEGVLTMHIANNQVLFEFPFKEVSHPQVHITSRLIEGEYPNYQDIIPTKFKTHATLSREEFLNQIKTASLFSGKVNEVKISPDPEKNQVLVSAKSNEVGEHESVIPAKVEGDPIAVSFNYRYLVEGLNHIQSSEVVFDISKEDGPCILRPVGDASYTYVVMPIKPII